MDAKTLTVTVFTFASFYSISICIPLKNLPAVIAH
jgi:hypothetical protein